MNTISISPDLYNYAENYATKHNISISTLVEHYILHLLRREQKQDFQMKEIEELSPQVQMLVGAFPVNSGDMNDLNGDKARMEYLKEKLGL